jgi:DnaJ-class molecular chaperone
MKRKAQPLVLKLPVSAKQLYTGAKLRFIVNKRVECDERGCTSGYESYEVDVQPGTRAGEEIVIEEGYNEYTNADPSDIVFKVVEIPSPGFERNGLNLIYRMTISLKEVLGCDAGSAWL